MFFHPSFFFFALADDKVTLSCHLANRTVLERLSLRLDHGTHVHVACGMSSATATVWHMVTRSAINPPPLLSPQLWRLLAQKSVNRGASSAPSTDGGQVNRKVVEKSHQIR